ncbi:MAG: teichoic acid biosynthesis protein [Betaproteobacteria bacterium RIFCSPLOWO2_12_FULL_68_20]|nr:MAG: teichoic acid biosynthesis protein [Betaproteobacteria bacterium RIFCSPLOWO2_12_FULL_68_20]
MRERVLGTPIDALDLEICVERIAAWAAAAESRTVCACNVHSVVTARRDPSFAAALEEADLCTADGAPIAWRLRRLGHRGQPRVSGPDLMWRLCARAESDGLPIFLYGCRDETLERLRSRFARVFPRLRVAGSFAPPFRPLEPREDEAVVGRIARSGARIVFVALGCPKQELWLAAHRGRIAAVLIGVGAAFDFHAGVVRRAPPWMRRAGLEWLYRLAREPRRLWRRYLVTNALFAAYLAGQVLGERSRR